MLKSFTVMPKNLTLYGGISSPSKLTSRLAFYRFDSLTNIYMYVESIIAEVQCLLGTCLGLLPLGVNADLIPGYKSDKAPIHKS